MQPLSPQQSLQLTLQILQEDLKLRRSKHQTQISFKEENIYEEQEHPTNILQNSLWQPRERFSSSNIVYDIHENAY